VPALRFVLRICVFIVIAGVTVPAPAQDWPAGTTRIVVPYAAGGPVDFPARLLIDRLTT
jgi:tripartite-type tricarboxylate transporter receptor subunit TctC